MVSYVQSISFLKDLPSNLNGPVFLPGLQHRSPAFLAV